MVSLLCLLNSWGQYSRDLLGPRVINHASHVRRYLSNNILSTDRTPLQPFLFLFFLPYLPVRVPPLLHLHRRLLCRNARLRRTFGHAKSDPWLWPDTGLSTLSETVISKQSTPYVQYCSCLYVLEVLICLPTKQIQSLSFGYVGELRYDGPVGLNLGYLSYFARLLFRYDVLKILVKAPYRLIFGASWQRAIFADLCLPRSIVPNFVTRRLKTRNPEPLGEARLCLLCRHLLTSQQRSGLDKDIMFNPRDTSRRHNDPDLLAKSATAGCQICVRLLDWTWAVWNKKERSGFVFLVFAIRARLQDTDTLDEYELVFSILNCIQPYEYTNFNMFHTLTLRIVRDRGELAILSCTQRQIQPLSAADLAILDCQ